VLQVSEEMSAELRPDDRRVDDQRIDIAALMGALLSRWLRVAIVTILALGTTFAILQFMPRLYESSAGILVEQRNNAALRVPGDQPAAQPTIPVEAMMSSQIELIKSRDTLLGVIDSENLRSEPEFTGIGFSPLDMAKQLLGRSPETRSVDEAVLENLNERLTVVRERDSAVISVIVRSTSPELAARLANAIAAEHVERRTALSLADTAEASAWLEGEIARLRVKVEAAERAVAEYRVDNDLFQGANNTSVLDTQLSSIATQITAAQERKNAAQSRANLIRELLAGGQPIDGVEDVRNSVVIQQLSQTRATLQGELAQRSSTLLGNHPTIRALRAQVAEIEQQIAREGRRVADALEAQAQIEGDIETSLRNDLARLKQSASTATRDSVTLDSLQREAKAQRDLLESYLLRYSDASSRTNAGSALPDVRVITVAAPAVSPASPKTGMVLGAVGFVSLALQIGGILFGELMSGRALTERYSRTRREDETAVSRAELAAVDRFDEPPAAADFSEEEQEEAAAEEPEPTEPEAETAPLEAEEPEAEEDMPLVAVEEPVEVPLAAALPAGDDADIPSYREQFEAFETAVSPVPDRSTPGADESALELGNLSADIALGRVRVVMLAGLAGNRDCESVADLLVEEALKSGLSVARIDGGSGRISTAPGLTDLAAETASFGDVVHRLRDGLAEVPWGHQSALERRSSRPATLIEALGDIYEVVIVSTGRIGLGSSLPVFAGIPCRLVLVGAVPPDRESVERAVEDAADLGFEIGQIVGPPRQPAVA
jgi:uncharacterized protein involved in exopolysaccharide biosynthesis